MGAKQSKRSVDISGKEAEGGGEVAAAGAGGEGRVEQIADVDALKPQINGEAHIKQEQTDKEKELDSGTPENEKDATTEKESKEENKEAAPVTNGEAEEKIENGETTPTPEDGKKPKKEKVKKKWSLRSISFSRKDKPKQEKKQKDEEPKTNGEPEKVPEETPETTPESVTNEVAEEAKAPVETKEETTPETPVTEPLTNGTSTPESTKAETPATEEAEPVSSPVQPKPTEPEQLPVNGLSLEEPKPDNNEAEKIEESKVESPAAEPVETAPAPEIPVKEVCVEQMPLLEPTPPPLPANPPPSSVVSFAATTMAPELTDASLVNTTDTANAPPSAPSITKEILDDDVTKMSVSDNNVANDPLPSVQETVEKINHESEKLIVNGMVEKVDNEFTPEVVASIETILDSETKIESPIVSITEVQNEPEKAEVENNEVIENEPIPTTDQITNLVSEINESNNLERLVDDTFVNEDASVKEHKEITSQVDDIVESTPTMQEISTPPPEPECKSESEDVDIPLPLVDAQLISSDSDLPLPPPPPSVDDVAPPVDAEEPVKAPESNLNVVDLTQETVLTNSNHIQETMDKIENHDINGDENKMSEQKDKNEVRVVSENEKILCNGDGSDHEQLCNDAINGPSANGSVNGGECSPLSASAAELPPPPADLCDDEPPTQQTPQEIQPVADKLSDLIPEVPDVPELKTESETVSDVAVAN